MNPTSSEISVANIMIGANHPVRIMGVLNISQESFYRESIVSVEELAEVVSEMSAKGADFVDIGGASTAPQNIYDRKDIHHGEERERIERAMDAIGPLMDEVPISIDTSSSEVAEMALSMGAKLINDVTGLQGDSRMASLIADTEVPVIIMANSRQECSSIDMIMKSLRKSLEIADNAGIAENKIILDPGVGFGKPKQVDLGILRNLRLFTYMRRPLLVGVSRKAFIGDVLEIVKPEERLYGSLAAAAIAVYNGANILRTHDVQETLEVVRIAQAIKEEVRQEE